VEEETLIGLRWGGLFRWVAGLPNRPSPVIERVTLAV